MSHTAILSFVNETNNEYFRISTEDYDVDYLGFYLVGFIQHVGNNRDKKSTHFLAAFITKFKVGISAGRCFLPVVGKPEGSAIFIVTVPQVPDKDNVTIEIIKSGMSIFVGSSAEFTIQHERQIIEIVDEDEEETKEDIVVVPSSKPEAEEHPVNKRKLENTFESTDAQSASSEDEHPEPQNKKKRVEQQEKEE